MTQHSFTIKTADMDPDEIIIEVVDMNLKEELCSCEHLPVHSQLERVFHQLQVCSQSETSFLCSFWKTWIMEASNTFYARENITLLDRFKVACTGDGLAKLREILMETDVIESCSRERMYGDRRFYKLKKLPMFATLLKDILMGCKDVYCFAQNCALKSHN